MNRDKNEFDKLKITQASTNKVALNLYYDAFPIEMLCAQAAKYDTGESIRCYLGFEEVALLATDAASGRLIRELQEKGKKDISIGGSKSSKNYGGAPESRIISLGYSDKNGAPKIFVNISRGKGKLTDNGAISPDGAPDLKISVPMEVDKFRSMLIYAHDWINAHLVLFVRDLVRESEAKRKSAITES